MAGWQSSTRWQQVRLLVLERDEYRCRIRGERCEGTATDADHIIPWEDGGAKFDPANLRASCGWCNRSRASKQKHREGWRRSETEIVLVVGPPGAGKSTLVADMADAADVVVDYDQIARAFGAQLPRGHRERHDVVSAARGAVLSRIRRGEVEADRVWIVSSNPAAEDEFPHHRVEVVDPGRDEVLRRAADDGRPTSLLKVIEDWYEARDAGLDGPSRDWYGAPMS